jgi:hypothetical protein
MTSRRSTRRITFVVIVANLAVTATLAWLVTAYKPVDLVLDRSTWEAGTPSSTYITAFATLRPWWERYAPEAIRVRPDGGIEHLVRIPRGEIEETGEEVLPSRGVGYYMILGGLTAARSLFSGDLVFDFPFIVRFQRFLLIAALTLAPLALWAVHPCFRRRSTFLVYNVACLPVLFLWPHREKFLPDGIVDSAVANALAVLGACAFLLVARHSALREPRSKTIVVASGLFLGFCSMVRGEFLLVYAFVLLFLAIVTLRDRKAWRGLAVVLVLLLLFPIANGLVNKTVHGHFVPFRMQSGQNLFEPIGQYPNPYGIEYRDKWIGDYLEQQGLEYFSFEADRFLTAKYFEALRENPSLFFSNFHKRLRYFSGELDVWLDVWTIPIVLLLVGFLAFRDDRFVRVSIPLVMAIGYLLLFGWLNKLLRLVTPAHFLIDIFFCFAAAYLLEVFRGKGLLPSFRKKKAA